MNWRDLAKYMGPGWFVKDQITLSPGVTKEVDNRALYAFLLMLDTMKQRLRYGVEARLTQWAPVDALQYIGAGLDTIQGPSESIAAYRARLQTAIDDKRLAGTAWPLLRQIRGYCSPYAVRVRLVNEHGHWYTIDRDGSQSTYRYSAWDWDGATAFALKTGATRVRGNGVSGPAIPWSRFWVVIYPTTGSPSQPWQRDGTWDDGSTWDDNGQTWGSTATPDDVDAIRKIVTRWKPMGSRCVSIIISFSDTDFDPTTTAPPLADGTWKWAGKYSTSTPGVRVNARSTNAIFWDGTSVGADL